MNHPRVLIDTVFENVVTELVKVSVDAKYPNNYFNVYTIESADFIAKQMVVRLDAFFNSVTHEDEKIEITYPENWWEALKARWFPNWLLCRYPAKYTTHNITTKITKICPHLPVEKKVEQQTHLVWLMQKEEDHAGI